MQNCRVSQTFSVDSNCSMLMWLGSRVAQEMMFDHRKLKDGIVFRFLTYITMLHMITTYIYQLLSDSDWVPLSYLILGNSVKALHYIWPAEDIFLLQILANDSLQFPAFLRQRNTPTTRGGVKWPSYYKTNRISWLMSPLRAALKVERWFYHNAVTIPYFSSFERMKNQTSVKFQTFNPTSQRLLWDLISNARLRKGCALCEKEMVERKHLEFRSRAQTIGCEKIWQNLGGKEREYHGVRI